MKYHSLSLSIDAVNIGDLNLLVQSLPHVDVRMAVSLTLVAIERDHIHLMGCLLEKLVRERVFEVRNDKSVEPLLYIGLDATPYSACSLQSKPSAEVVDIVNRSLVMCLFKILYHTYIFLDINSIFDLVQVLLCEGLYYFQKEDAEEGLGLDDSASASGSEVPSLEVTDEIQDSSMEEVD